MKVFVTGANGQLGYDVMRELTGRGFEAVGSDVTERSEPHYIMLDITDQQAVNEVIRTVNPDAVIHCAAWTAVDNAEDADKRDTVRKINTDGAQYIAQACKEIGAKMMNISTDYVFDGQGTTPWDPDCKNYAPLNIYGQTKLEGELAVSRTLDKFFIVRTAWAFGLTEKTS